MREQTETQDKESKDIGYCAVSFASRLTGSTVVVHLFYVGARVQCQPQYQYKYFVRIVQCDSRYTQFYIDFG